MQTQPARTATLTLAASLLLVTLGAAVLLGWAFDIAALRSFLPDSPTMKANAALAILLCGITLVLVLEREPSKITRRLAALLAILVATIGALTLSEFLAGRDLGIDQLLFHEDVGGALLDYPGRMSPGAALSLVFAGLALFLASMGNGLRWRWPLLTALGTAITVMAAIVCMGYLLNVLLHTAISIYPGMALSAAVCFLVLGLGLLSLVRTGGHLSWSLGPSPTRAIVSGVVFLVLLAVLSNILSYQLELDDRWVAHTQQVLKEVEAVSECNAEIESALLGYVVSGEERFVAQRAHSYVAREGHLEELRSLTRDNPWQQRRLDQLKPLIAQRHRLTDEIIAAPKRERVTVAELQSAVESESPLTVQIRQVLNDIRDEEVRLLDRRGKQSQVSSSRAFLLLPLGLFLTLTMLSAALFFLNDGVNEQQQAERALLEANENLRSSEDQLRLMVSGVKDYAIFLLDPEGRIATWNLGAQRLKGWAAEEIIGQHFSRFYSAEELADRLPQRELEIAKAEGQFTGEGWRIRKDGSRFWANVTISPVERQGRLVGFSKVTRDTTERRRIERAMQEEEARLAAVIGSAMDGMITVDENQVITLFNPAAEKMFGYEAAALLGTSLKRLIPERFRATHGSHMRNFAEANVSRRKIGALVPIYGLRADGQEFPIDASISKTHVGGRTIFSVILRDLSERVAMEEARRMSETNFATLVNQAPQFVWTSTPEGLNTFFNQRWYDYTGMTPEQSRGTGWNTPFHPDDKQAGWEAWGRAAASGEMFNVESRLKAADGGYRWFLIRGEPVRDASGAIIKWLGTCTDIDEMKNTQSALTESDKRFQLMANSIPQLAWMALGDGHIFWYNQRWYDYTGKSFEEMEGWGWKSVHDPQVLSSVTERWAAAIANGEPFSMEFPLRGADGSFRMFLTRVMPLKNSQGQVTHWFGTNTDISEMRRAQALQTRSQKLEALGTLSGGIAHDFNNILLSITGNAKLAIADLPADHPVQESLLEIARGGARATDLVRRILSFSRPSEMKRQVIELQPVVEEALKLVRATIPVTIEFRTNFADPLPAVLADTTQVHQIVVNLVANAAHAIGSRSDGAIEIRLDTAELTAEDGGVALGLPEGRYVRLFIGDNGCGMDRPTLDRIYDPFFTTKKPGEGTGLGLSVVHGIMKNHDGGIAVYSEPGRGTAFRLFFPAAGSAATVAPEPPREEPRHRTERILYVDDEDALVALVKRTLERLGYKVTGQTNPAAALELFRRNPAAFDAVVTDLAMPQLSGFDLATQLLALRPELPIVMTSGYVRPEDQERALAIGLRDLILKPDTIEQLARTLDALFHHQPSPATSTKPLS